MRRDGYNDRGEPNGCTESRMVHYILDRGPRSGRHIAAVITDVHRSPRTERKTGEVSLELLPAPRDGIMEKTLVAVPYDPKALEPGTWHYPERVD